MARRFAGKIERGVRPVGRAIGERSHQHFTKGRAVAVSSTRKDLAQARAQVRNYLAALPADARRRLTQLRTIIRAAAPGSVEAFSYGIPAFRIEGRPLVWYASWKQHSSLYPITARIQRDNAAALKGFKTSRGTVRFPFAEPLPSVLIKRLVKARVAEVRALAKAVSSPGRR